VALFAAVVAVVGFLAMRRIQKTVDVMEEDTLPTLSALAEVRSAGHRIGVVSSELALGSTGTARREAVGRAPARVREAKDLYETAISRLEALPQNADDRRIGGEIRAAAGRLLSLSDRIVEMSERGAPPADFLETVSLLESTEEGYFRVVDEAIAFKAKEAAEESVALRATLEKTKLVGAALGALAVVLALLVGLSTSRSILRPLRSLEAAVAGIRSGDLSARAHVATGDELGALGESFNRMGEELGRNVAERKRAAKELRGSRERYRAIFEANPQPLWVEDAESLAVLAVNEAAATNYGYSHEELLSMKSSDLRPSTAPPAPEGEKDAVVQRRKDGTTIFVEIATHDILFAERKARLVLAHDVTQRTLLEEQLRQAQKMEAIGQLAGGVAHDFNNLLTVILGYTDILLGNLRGDDSSHALLEEVQKAGNRAASLTRQLLAFSRKQVLEPKVVDLNETVGSVQTLLRRLIGEDIALATALSPRLSHVRVDQGQIEQVLMNLAINARDAMPRGGKLTIETANVELDAHYAESHPEVRPGPYVLLAMSDTGTGMDEQTKARIFEPFFTTKGVGKGTGLGLSVVHGVVRQSDGHIAVYSEKDRGTTFKIYLPPAEKELISGTAHPRLTAGAKGSETILLVEDEDAVRRFARLALEMSGYTVLEARHGAEAFRLAERHDGPIDLLVSDVIMPEMGGGVLAEQLLEARPGIKVLFVSGYTDDAVVRHGIVRADVAFLQKPFTPQSLTRKVREVLG